MGPRSMIPDGGTLTRGHRRSKDITKDARSYGLLTVWQTTIVKLAKPIWQYYSFKNANLPVKLIF